MHQSVMAGAFAATLLGVMPAAAEDCKPLQMISSIDLEIRDRTILVPVSVNGKTAKMILSTSNGITSFTAAGAAAMGLDPISNSSVVMLNTTGQTSESYVVAEDLAAGNVHVHHGQYMVLPVISFSDQDVVGTLGGDLLSRYDVEFDFAARKLNLFSQDHCPGKVIYWKHAAATVVPLSEQQPTANGSRTGYLSYIQRAVQMWVPVTLDNQRFQGRIGLSASSSMDSNAAKGAMGVDAGSPGSEPLPDATAGSKGFLHTFSGLAFDGITITNPKFIVYPDRGADYARNWQRTDSRLARVMDTPSSQLVVGMDVLRKLHLFASFGEHRLYITEAGAESPVAQSAAAP